MDYSRICYCYTSKKKKKRRNVSLTLVIHLRTSSGCNQSFCWGACSSGVEASTCKGIKSRIPLLAAAVGTGLMSYLYVSAKKAIAKMRHPLKNDTSKTIMKRGMTNQDNLHRKHGYSHLKLKWYKPAMQHTWVVISIFRCCHHRTQMWGNLPRVKQQVKLVQTLFWTCSTLFSQRKKNFERPKSKCFNL